VGPFGSTAAEASPAPSSGSTVVRPVTSVVRVTNQPVSALGMSMVALMRMTSLGPQLCAPVLETMEMVSPAAAALLMVGELKSPDTRVPALLTITLAALKLTLLAPALLTVTTKPLLLGKPPLVPLKARMAK
jgi:hypothetical protein